MAISFNGHGRKTLALRALGAALALCALVPAAGLLAADTSVISSVEVSNDGGVTRIVLTGAEDPIYTAFMRENPRRLIIDLPDVMFDGVDTPIAVNDGVVESITLGAFGDPKVSPTMARVSVSLAGDAEYELVPEGGRLVVKLTPTGGARTAKRAEPAPSPEVAEATSKTPAVPEAPRVAQPATQPLPSREQAQAAPEAAPKEQPQGAQPQVAPQAKPSAGGDAMAQAAGVKPDANAMRRKQAAPAETAKAAPAQPKQAALSRIVKVIPHADHVEVVSEGPIDNVDSFTLSDPDRVVIDFWGAKNAVWPDKFSPKAGPISRVRLGEHADKVRLVLDLRAPLESHAVEATATGVRIEFESADSSARSADDAAGRPPAASDAAAAEQAAAGTGAEETSAKAAAMPHANGTPPKSTDAKPGDSAGAEASELDPGSGASEPSASAGASEAGRGSASADYTYAGEVRTVESVHFESVAGLDRVVVQLSGRVNAQLVEPDAMTAIVELPGAVIRPDAERRVDTREFHGPVEVFSAFKTPEMAGDHVRLVLKRRPGAVARLVWESNLLKVEFPHAAAVQPAAADRRGAAEGAAAVQRLDETSHAMSPEGAHELIPAAIDPFAPEGDFSGPAAAAAIDILNEGGFTREKEYQGRRISLDFKDADMGNILRLIAEVSDLNVIAGEEVSGKVTLRLVDVPWDQALDIILLTKGLGFVRIGNILRIAPVDILQREEQARLQERRAKEKLEDLVVKLQPVNYASVGELRGMVKRLLSSRGSVIVDKRTSTLIIKDIPSVIHEATALIKAIDTQTPQVLIEAKIVEASLDFSRALGARWGVGYNHQGGRGGNQDLRLGPDTQDVVPGFGTGQQQSNFIVSNPVASSIGTLTMGLLGLDDKIQLDLQLQAAETSSKGKVISSPRVVTLDNRTATIQQGVAIRFDASDGDSVSTSFVDAVLKLDVTPHITADRSIIMKINVSRNAPQLNQIGDAVGISKNETSTEALVRDGQTMVLGGIYTVDKGTGRTKMPFLADVPILGPLFRSVDTQDVRKELLIFVTPYVVQEATPGS